MKKFFAFFSLVALSLTACDKGVDANGAKGEGSVAFKVGETTEVVETRTNVSCTTPVAEDFSLRIEGVDATYAADYDNITIFNENNYLVEGTYKAIVATGDVKVEGYDKAAFVGSAEFAVEARKHTDVEITATIANALVKVEVTEAFTNYFEGGHSLKLTTAAGNEFDVTEQTEPLFIAPGAFTVSGSAIKQPNQSGKDGVEVTLPECKNESAAAQTLYTVKLDVENAGQATLTITLNDTLVESIDIEQELNDNAE